MDQKRSRNRDENLSDGKNNQEFASNNKSNNSNQLRSISITDRDSTDYSEDRQNSLFQAVFWFWSQQSSWSYFSRGLFWGGIIACTSVFSATCGIAFTKIDAVEKIIARTIEHSYPTSKRSQQSLTHPVNILLLEVKPDDDEIVRFSQNSIGKSKTILLLQFEPQSNTARIVNIPINSRVKIPGFGWGTIEDANKYGGTPLVSQSVAQLLDGIIISRYIKGTTGTFAKLTSSGKITLNRCNNLIQDCSNPAEQISRQQAAIETIRQRLNIPIYFSNFKATLSQTKSNLDTNLSLSEVMAIANFVKGLESDSITVDVISNYTVGKSIDSSNRLKKSRSTEANSRLVQSSLKKERAVKNLSIAVQNTTDNPKLGMRFVSYLRGKNFQDVYLVEHMPLKLNKTKIIVDRRQLVKAEQLKNIVGFGKLEPKYDPQQKSLIIQVGEDANYLPLKNSNP